MKIERGDNEMFKYEGCGLPNVWLVDGYKVKETPYGEAFSIENIEDLHKAIGLHLVSLPRKLTGNELRFLRKEMGLSQKRFGNLVGRNEQSIAIWEKTDGTPPKSAAIAERFLRLMFREYALGSVNVTESLSEMCELDYKSGQEKIDFSLRIDKDDQEWVTSEEMSCIAL